MPKYFTENIWAVWVSSFKIRAKIEIQEQFSMRLTSRTNLLMSCYVARYVSPKCVSVWLLPSKSCLSPLKSSLEFVLHRGKPKFISFPVKFPADRSKFQFYTTARELYCRVCVFFFLNPAAEIMIHMLFNTLLKITPHNRQKRRKRKERIK